MSRQTFRGYAPHAMWIGLDPYVKYLNRTRTGRNWLRWMNPEWLR